MHVITEYKQQLLLTLYNIIMRLFKSDTLSSHAITKNVCKSDFLPSAFHDA